MGNYVQAALLPGLNKVHNDVPFSGDKHHHSVHFPHSIYLPGLSFFLSFFFIVVPPVMAQCHYLLIAFTDPGRRFDALFMGLM